MADDFIFTSIRTEWIEKKKPAKENLHLNEAGRPLSRPFKESGKDKEVYRGGGVSITSLASSPDGIRERQRDRNERHFRMQYDICFISEVSGDVSQYFLTD